METDVPDDLLRPKKEPRMVTTRRIFVPGKRDMKIQYPELGDMEEFTNMADKDIRFCWYFACKSSEFSKIQDRDERLQRSILEAYGVNYFNNSTAKKIANGDTPEYIRVGIMAMGGFSPKHRSEANALVELMFKNLQLAVEVDDGAFEIWSPSEKKAYVELLKTTNATLPDLVSQIERGFSTVAPTVLGDQKETQEEHSTLMDQIMEESTE